MKMLNKGTQFVVLFVWLTGILFSISDCLSTSNKRGGQPTSTKKSIDIIGNKQVTNSDSGTDSGIGGSSSSSGSSTNDSSSGRIGSGGSSNSSGSSTNDSSSGRIGSGGSSNSSGSSTNDSSSGRISSGGNSSSSDISGSGSGNGNLQDRILEKAGKNKNLRYNVPDIKIYINDTLGQLEGLKELKQNIALSKKVQYSDVTDDDVLHSILDLMHLSPTHNNSRMLNGNTADGSSDLATLHGSSNRAMCFRGISIKSPANKQNVCYIAVLLEVLSVLPDSIIADGDLKKLMKGIRDDLYEKDQHGRLEIPWGDLPSGWQTQGENQSVLEDFIDQSLKPLLKDVGYYFNDTYVGENNAEVILCNTILPDKQIQLDKNSFSLVAQVVRAGIADQAGHFYTCAEYKGKWYKSRFNSESAVRMIGSEQEFMEDDKSRSEVVLRVYV